MPVNGGDFDIVEARTRCREYLRRILDLSQKVPAMHIAPAFSCIEILDVIYAGFIVPSERRDTFVLSKGHGVMAQYVILEKLGIIDSDELDGAERDGSRFGGHPDRGLPGIEASTGSLGHGLPMAVGLAYGDRLTGKERRVFVVASDGELQEGSTWEALMLASSLGLGAIVAVVDLNDLQGLGRISEMLPSFYPIDEKLRSFGWDVVCVDGHDSGALYDAIARAGGERPTAIVATTTKGKGVSYMEGVPIWHYRSPSAEEYEQALAEVSEQ